MYLAHHELKSVSIMIVITIIIFVIILSTSSYLLSLALLRNMQQGPTRRHLVAGQEGKAL